MAESARLLGDVEGEDHTAHIDTNNDEFEARTGVPGERVPASAHFKRSSKILTTIIAVCSAVTVALLIANYIIVTNGPFKWYIYRAQDTSVGLGIFLLISFIASIINLRVNVPVLLNIIVDIILLLGVFTWDAGLIGAWPGSSWCDVEYGYPRPGNPNPEPYLPPPACYDWKLVVRILMGIAAGLAGIAGASQLALLVLRTMALFRTKFWSRPFPWSFPTGQITLELSMKILRQETGGSAVGASASLRGPQGPVADA